MCTLELFLPWVITLGIFFFGIYLMPRAGRELSDLFDEKEKRDNELFEKRMDKYYKNKK